MSEDDIGVVITFNSQSMESVGGPMLMEGDNCINPLNWKTDGTLADASLNKGSQFFNDATTGALMTTDLDKND